MKTSRMKQWQAAFIVGMCLFLVTSASFFGLSVVTTIIAFLAVILGIVNTLISPVESAGTRKNVLLMKVKSLLNEPRYLELFTVSIWGSTLILLVYSFQSSRHKTQVSALNVPLRISYRKLPAPDILDLLEGKASKRLSSQLGGQPFIIPTAAFDVAKTLLDEGYENLSESWYLSLRELPQLKHDDGWNLLFRMHKSIFWKLTDPMRSSHLMQPDTASRFLGRYQLPDDFYITTIDYDACGDSGEEIRVSGTVHFRQPLLLAAIIENKLNESVQIGNLFLKENPTQGFDRRQSHVEVREKSAPKAHPFLPTILGSGESIVLPLETIFTLGNTLLEENTDELEYLKNALRQSSLRYYRLHIGPEVEVQFPRAELMRMVSTDDAYSSLRDYVAGPSLSLSKITVDNIVYPVRNPSPEDYVLLGGDALPATSCPFLYTFDETTGTWINEGSLLYGFWGKERESVDKRILSHFDGRLLLKEVEAEISYIDFLSVKMILTNGEQINIPAMNDALRFVDGDYLKLQQGDEVEVGFDTASLDSNSTYLVVAKGYYQPVEKK